MKPSPNTAEMSAAPAMNPATKPQIGSRMKKYRSPAKQNATPMITARIPIRISTVPLLVQNPFESFRGIAESGGFLLPGHRRGLCDLLAWYRLPVAHASVQRGKSTRRRFGGRASRRGASLRPVVLPLALRRAHRRPLRSDDEAD